MRSNLASIIIGIFLLHGSLGVSTLGNRSRRKCRAKNGRDKFHLMGIRFTHQTAIGCGQQ